jgi:hypothetical protein
MGKVLHTAGKKRERTKREEKEVLVFSFPSVPSFFYSYL